MEKSKVVNERMGKRILAILLIFTMLFAHFALVGSNVVEAVSEETKELKQKEELENQDTITKGENVEFDAYFKQNTKNVHTKSLKIEETQKLYLELEAEDKATIPNATIKIEDPNFSIKEDKLQKNRYQNKYITKVNAEENEIEVENISSNNTIVLEIPIMAKKPEKVNEEYLNKEIKIKLDGKYENINKKQRVLKGEVKVRPKWTSKVGVNLSQSIQKYFSLGQNGTLLEQNIETEIKDNALPSTLEVVETKAPDLGTGNPEEVIVLIDGARAEGEQVEYNRENGIVKITNENQQDDEGKYDWTHDKKEYEIMYHYSNATPVKESKIKLLSKAQDALLTQTDIASKEEEKEVVAKPIGNIATIETKILGDLYKGYLYENETKEINYEEKNTITVSYTEGITAMALDTNNNVYGNQNGKALLAANNIRYVQTKINKQNLLNILGEDGRIFIKRGEEQELISLGAETQTDERGDIVVAYGEGETNITIETTQPIKEGKINITHVKAINGAMGQTKQALTALKTLIVSPIVATNISKEGNVSVAELKETKTEAKLEINRSTLSTVGENKNVELKAILKTDSAEHDLFANPRLVIEFPEAVKEVKVKSISKFYGDEFVNIIPSQGEVDGKQTILIDLVGEQTIHKGTSMEETMINIEADIKLDAKASSKKDNIVMAYTNSKAIQYAEGTNVGLTKTPIKIESPRRVISTNNIKALDIETAGEEKGVSKTIEKNSPERIFTVESEIVNNDKTAVTDVKVLGTFGTKGKAQINGGKYENNIESSLVSPLTVETIDASKIKIYYTENENATDDLEEAENGWQEEITNREDTKKYLITISDMEVSEVVKVGYNISVPSNLGYDKQMYQGYTTKYIKDEKVSESPSTIIELNTEKGAELQTKVIANVGGEELEDEASVKRGEKIEYTIETKNIGDEPLQNAKVVGEVPEGTKLLTSIEDSFGDYEESEEKEVSFDAPEIQPGETVKSKYIVMVEDDAEFNSDINMTGRVEHDSSTIKSVEKKLKVEDVESKVKVYVDYYQANNKAVSAGENISIRMKVENTTQEVLKKVKATWILPEGFTIENNRTFLDFTSQNKDTTCEIPEIQPGETEIVIAEIKTDQGKKNGYYPIYGKVECDKETYRTNLANVRMEGNEDLNIEIESNKEDQDVKAGDIITYNIKMKNNKEKELNGVNISDMIHTYLMVREATLIESEQGAKPLQITDNVDIMLDFKAKEEKQLNLKAEVVCIDQLEKDVNITNKVTVKHNGEPLTESREVTSILKATVTKNPTVDPDNPDNPDNPNDSNNPQNPNDSGNTPSTDEGTISGYAWIDTDSNGSKDSYENTIENMPIKLFDVNKNSVIDITASTDNTGYYALNNIPEGEYIVLFEYDSRLYKVTEYKKDGVESSMSSKAVSKTLDIEGENKIYGITDFITIGKNTKVESINIGLEPTGKFDFALDKYISKVTVETAEGETKTYNYNKETLAKVELSSKKMEGAKVTIEYNLDITNNGEIVGYVKTIEDYMPSDMVFDKNLNQDWEQEGTTLKTDSLENKAIMPGETRTINLVLTKTMTQNNTGIIGNTAEITEAYNREGTQDVNSTPGNKINSENDYGAADVIVGVKTGAAVAYTSLVLLMLLAIGLSIYYIKKGTLKSNKNIEEDEE